MTMLQGTGQSSLTIDHQEVERRKQSRRTRQHAVGVMTCTNRRGRPYIVGVGDAATED
jgi:hypothetical protein